MLWAPGIHALENPRATKFYNLPTHLVSEDFPYLRDEIRILNLSIVDCVCVCMYLRNRNPVPPTSPNVIGLAQKFIQFSLWTILSELFGQPNILFGIPKY